MNVVAINGSPRHDGNTGIALDCMAGELRNEGIPTEIIHVGNMLLHGCIGCSHCFSSENNLCVFQDDGLNAIMSRMREADGLIIGSPTYFGGIPGTLKCFLDRVFYASRKTCALCNKVGAAVVAVRRAGGVDVFRQINNYFTLSEMVIPPSQYWVVGYGMAKGEIRQDAEGMQTVRRNANAMAWQLKVIAAAKGSIPLPRDEKREMMNFIR